MSAPVAECGMAVNVSATGNVTSGAGCQMLGFYVNSTSSGTVVFRAGGSSGRVLNGTITPAIGFHRFPATVDGVLHLTVGGTIDITVFFATGN